MTPVHTNLPTTLQFAENVAIGTYVIDVKVKDWNYEEWQLTGDVLEYSILTEATHFATDSTGNETTQNLKKNKTKKTKKKQPTIDCSE